MVEGEKAPRVGPPADGRAHLPRALAHVLRQGREGVVRPARGVPRRPAAAGVAPGPVADLAPQAHVAHLAAAAVRPLVHRGLGDAGVGVRGAYLLGREAPRHAAPYHGGLARGALLGVAYAAPRVGGLGLRRPLRLRRPAEHLRPPERPQPPCSGHPLQRLGHEAGLGHVAARSSGAGSPPPGPRRPHEPVPGDLVVDRRGRPAEVGRHRPAALVAAQPPLHGEPVGLREPRVGPSGPVRPPLRAIPAVLRHPRHPNPGGDARAGLSGPQASGSATQPYVCGWVAESFGWNSDSR